MNNLSYPLEEGVSSTTQINSALFHAAQENERLESMVRALETRLYLDNVRFRPLGESQYVVWFRGFETGRDSPFESYQAAKEWADKEFLDWMKALIENDGMMRAESRSFAHPSLLDASAL